MISITTLIVHCLHFTFEYLISWHYALSAIALQSVVAELPQFSVAPLSRAKQDS